MFQAHEKSGKNSVIVKSETVNLFEKIITVSILCLYFLVTPVQVNPVSITVY